jgi:hypothetical protein
MPISTKYKVYNPIFRVSLFVALPIIPVTNIRKLKFFFYPAFTTLYEFEPPHSRGFEITHKNTPLSVGLL